MVELAIKEIGTKALQNFASELLNRAMDMSEFKTMKPTEAIEVLRELKCQLSEMPIEHAAEIKKMLPQHLQDLLDLDNRPRLPTEGTGSWTGEPGNSTFVPARDQIPANKGYNNLEGKTWGDILGDIKGIPYVNGYPDFSSIAVETIELEDIGSFTRYTTSAGEGVHDRAFAALAKKWGKTVEEVRDYKEKNNLVWHECQDGKTLQLVSREIHDNLPHKGGIALYSKVEAYLAKMQESN